MKKLFILVAVGSLVAVTSCNHDDDNNDNSTSNVDIATQNSYDDAAIKTFITSNYLDAKGNIKAFSSTDAADDNYPNLTTYNPVTLPSGVVYIVIPNAQPINGKAVNADEDIDIFFNNRIETINTNDLYELTLLADGKKAMSVKRGEHIITIG